MDNYLFKTIRYIFLQSGRQVLRIFSKSYRKDYAKFQNMIKKFTPKKGVALHITDTDKLYSKEYFKSSQFETEKQWVDKMSMVIDGVLNPSLYSNYYCNPL